MGIATQEVAQAGAVGQDWAAATMAATTAAVAVSGR